MKSKHQKLLSWYKAKDCTLNLKINLDRLFKKSKEKEMVDTKWKDFIASDPDNKKVYGASQGYALTSGAYDGAWRSYALTRRNLLKYRSEQLISTKTDNRSLLLLVLGNSATHSVESGMFFYLKAIKRNIDSGAEFLHRQAY